MRKEGKHWNKIGAELSPTCKIEESVLRNSVLLLAVLVEKCLKQKSLLVGEGRQPPICDRAAAPMGPHGGLGDRFCRAQSTQGQGAAPRGCWGLAGSPCPAPSLGPGEKRGRILSVETETDSRF